jgi:hypothetical protein
VRHLELTLHDVLHDSIHEFLHVDGKIFQTLKMLFTKPGFLTREYLAGRRMRFINPIRLYLTMSVIYFVLASLLLSAADVGVNINIHTGKTAAAEVHQSAEDMVFNIGLSEDEGENAKSPIGRFLKNGAQLIKKNPEAFVEKLRHSFPKILFVLVPLFASLIWLAFIRQKRSWLSCLYFSLHFHAAVFAGLILTLPFRKVMSPTESLPQTICFIWLFVYLAYAFKRVWGDTSLKAYLRAASVLSVYFLCFGLTVTGLVLIQFYMLGARF